MYSEDEWKIPALDSRPIYTCQVCKFESADEVALVSTCDFPGGPITGKEWICLSCIQKWNDACESGDISDYI
jgi:hypothetical protein